jgi:hypothetical protein
MTEGGQSLICVEYPTVMCNMVEFEGKVKMANCGPVEILLVVSIALSRNASIPQPKAV